MTSPHPAQGRQLTIGVTFLAWLNIYQTIKQLVQDAVAPEMQALKGEIKALSETIESLEKRMEEKFGAVTERFDAADKRLDLMDNRFDRLERNWELAIDVRERLAAIEARLEQR